MRSFLLIILFAAFSHISPIQAQANDYEKMAQDLLSGIRNGEDTKALQKTLAEVSVESLNIQLASDHQKLAFWINIYNAYIQIILSENPALYEDRRTFFKIKQIPIIQRKLAFADIEHGIIRRSQYEYFLGYLTKFFPPEYEETLRVSKRDPRIHFALNCGAKSCPPVAIYKASDLDNQFDKSTERYLTKETYIKEDEQAVYTVQLFRWFSGDFGGVDGVRDMLEYYKIIPQNSDLKLKTHSYDWTLDLGNYIDL